MLLYLKQKVFSWSDRFYVKDSEENDRFAVQGEFLSLGKKLHIYDASNHEVAFIRQKILAWFPRYFVEIGGHEVCQVVREFSVFRPKYRLDGLPWRVQGDFWAHEYSMVENDREVMRLYKHWFSWGDSYVLDIADPKEELLCLCVALAIDAAIEGEQSAASSSST